MEEKDVKEKVGKKQLVKSDILDRPTSTVTG